MHAEADPRAVAEHLSGLERALVSRARDLALYLVFDRPQRVAERPGLGRTFFAQRCASEEHLATIAAAFEEIGAYVEIFEGELPFLRALAEGRLQAMPQPLKIAYNEIEGGISWDGFAPGRKALIPTVTDAYGLLCSNSHAYGCAVGRHKFHYFTLLGQMGVQTPETWHFRPERGWACDRRPPAGVKVIVKSTYENWAVGVTEDSVFHVDEHCDERVSEIMASIGQPVTVQRFVPGREIGVSVFSTPDLYIPPPVETVLEKDPNNPDAVMTIYDNLNDESIDLVPYEGPQEVMRGLVGAAAHAFDVLELGSFARFDFRVDEAGGIWITDVGVSPGIGQTDAAFLSLAELGFDHPNFLRAVLAATLSTHGRLS